jgi:hypothetical protein
MCCVEKLDVFKVHTSILLSWSQATKADTLSHLQVCTRDSELEAAALKLHEATVALGKLQEQFEAVTHQQRWDILSHVFQLFLLFFHFFGWCIVLMCCANVLLC